MLLNEKNELHMCVAHCSVQCTSYTVHIKLNAVFLIIQMVWLQVNMVYNTGILANMKSPLFILGISMVFPII